MKLVVEEGWYSREEMITDLKWSETLALPYVRWLVPVNKAHVRSSYEYLRSRVEGAIALCKKNPDELVRLNQYDSVEEFWVKTRESGKRKQSQSFEQSHTKFQKALN